MIDDRTQVNHYLWNGWFDAVNRAVASAAYGALSSFSGPSTPPSRRDTELVTSMTFDDAGRVYQVTDPKGIVGRTGYDAAGRTTQTIADVGGLAQTVDFTYTLDNQTATLVAVNSDTGNQTTTYTYGTTLFNSAVASNLLLR